MRNLENLEGRLKRSGPIQEAAALYGTDLPRGAPANGEHVLDKLKARESAAKTASTLNKDEVAAIVVFADQKGFVTNLLAKTRKAILERTTALRDTEEIAQFGNTKMENGLLVRDTIREEWGVPVFAYGKAVSGKYIHAEKPSERIIRIAYPHPTRQETLASLATTGRLTPAEQIADHERLHAIQLNLGGTHIPPELIEAQAYRIEPISLSHDRLVNHVVSSEVYPTLDARKFASGVWSVDRLTALGFSPEEVVGIISNAGEWDEQQEVWRGVDACIEDTMTRSGYNAETLEGLLIINQLEKKIAQEEARAITQQVLYDAYRDKFVEISK